jgi:hypothetical protein
MIVDLRIELEKWASAPSKLTSKIQIQQSSIGNQSRFFRLGIIATEH